MFFKKKKPPKKKKISTITCQNRGGQNVRESIIGFYAYSAN